MKIGVIIPDRKDRPRFLKNCLRMLEHQTLKPHYIHIVNDDPENNKPDITWRYRKGYEFYRNKGFDIIALIENDDYYSPVYLETMVQEWIKQEQPDIIGTNYTIYYHLKLKAYFNMDHYHRASAMNTLIKPDLNLTWPKNEDPYTDLHLWKNIPELSKFLFRPENHIAIGMKHGEGLCGGRSHTDRLYRYSQLNAVDDPIFEFLKNNCDIESFKFYSNYYDTSKC